MIHLHGTQAVAFRVLIVDEDTSQSDILSRCVEMLGWTADRAANLDEAVEKFFFRPHNDVVINLALGQRDCLRLLSYLQRDHADPIVIFVNDTGDRDLAASLRMARDLGLRVAGTLLRPIDPYRLHALLLSNPARPSGDHRQSAPQPGAQELDQALRDGEIHTEYQPKTDLATGEFIGVEALARWHSPTLGLIPPDQFVPVAEQSDSINRLTFRVLTDAIAACRAWREVRPNCSVAVNLSPHVLADSRLLPNVDAILSQNRLPPCALIVEVAESALLSNLPAATEVLTRLTMKGVRVSIDDFGTGCSSVPSLLRLPFTEFKIDRSFIAVCRTDQEAWKLVRATVSLARELGIQVVAEGIETEDISDRLRDVGCDTGQGWYFGRPVREAAMLSWLSPEGSRTKTIAPATSRDALALQS